MCLTFTVSKHGTHFITSNLLFMFTLNAFTCLFFLFTSIALLEVYLGATKETMFGSSIPQVVCSNARVLLTLFVFVCV